MDESTDMSLGRWTGGSAYGLAVGIVNGCLSGLTCTKAGRQMSDQIAELVGRQMGDLEAGWHAN